MKANKSEKVGSKPFFDMCTYVDALKLCEVVWKEEFASENKKWRIDWENVLKHLPSHRTARFPTGTTFEDHEGVFASRDMKE